MIEDNDAGSLAHMAFKGFILICSKMMMVMDDDAWGTGTGTYGIQELQRHLIKNDHGCDDDADDDFDADNDDDGDDGGDDGS